MYKTNLSCMPQDHTGHNQQYPSIRRVPDPLIRAIRDQLMVIPDAHLKGEQPPQCAITPPPDVSTDCGHERPKEERNRGPDPLPSA
jgi:hypothetical protein